MAPHASISQALPVPRRRAVAFIVLLGVVSLFADMTYEGARSLTGPYLELLGASATVVSVASGVGELVGYALRLASGLVSDRTGRYWAVTIFGYTLNVFAVPLLAVIGRWELAVALMIAERMGRAIRSPARDAMLSHASSQTGLGWGFGLHEALDQTGAVLGPLVLSTVLFSGYGYRGAFGILLVPAILSMAVLLAAHVLFPRPRDFDLAPPALEARGLAGVFWVYLIAVGFIAAGYVDFPLIAFHVSKTEAVPTAWIPVLYALAMASDGVAALALGRAFDRIGLWTILGATLASAAAAPLVFFGGLTAAAIGMACWGIGIGAQESVMRAAIARLAPAERRGTAYGLFNLVYGITWFAGSALLGVLYDQTSPAWVAGVSVLLQGASLPVFFRLIRRSPS